MKFLESFFNHFWEPLKSVLNHEYKHEDDEVQCCSSEPESAVVEVPTTAVVVAVEAPLSPIGNIRKKFNKLTDLIVTSAAYLELEEVTNEEREWVNLQGDRVILFNGKSLLNIALLHAGYSYYSKSTI
jgi:hypothetical protein